MARRNELGMSTSLWLKGNNIPLETSRPEKFSVSAIICTDIKNAINVVILKLRATPGCH